MEIKLWYALNSNEKVVRIEDAKKGEEYFCPCCGAEVLPRALNSEKIRPHFYHKKGESCTEAEVHKWIKKDLFKVGQNIKVNTCEGIKEYIIKEILIEKTHKTSVGDYRPDITLITEDGDRIFVEIYNTNKKSIKKYYDKWFELRSTVIELKVEDIIDSEFNLSILEPIYEDNDKFRNFDDNDYKRLFGTENKKLRKDLECIYNILYDFAHYKIFINDALSLLYNNFNNRYSPSELYKLIDKYVCKYAKDIFFGDYEKYSGLVLESLNKEFGANFDINPLKNKMIKIEFNYDDEGLKKFYLSSYYIDIVAGYRQICLSKRINDKINSDEEYKTICNKLDNINGLDYKIHRNNSLIETIKAINNKLDEDSLNQIVKPIKDINNKYLLDIKMADELKNKKNEIINHYWTDRSDWEINELINILESDIYNFGISYNTVKEVYMQDGLYLRSHNLILRNLEYYKEKICFFE